MKGYTSFTIPDELKPYENKQSKEVLYMYYLMTMSSENWDILFRSSDKFITIMVKVIMVLKLSTDSDLIFVFNYLLDTIKFWYRLQGIPASGQTSINNIVLILGMAYISDTYYKQCVDNISAGTSSAPVRDRLRLDSLSLLDGGVYANFFTFNWGQEEDQCVPGRHFQNKFSARGAKAIFNRFSANSKPVVIRYIFLDYFRFPGAYMRETYGIFLSEMIPMLIALGLLSAETEMFVPNLKDLINNMHKKFIHTLEPIEAISYPLYEATEILEEKTELKQLLLYTNNGEVNQLDSKFPFLKIKFNIIVQNNKIN